MRWLIVLVCILSAVAAGLFLTYRHAQKEGLTTRVDLRQDAHPTIVLTDRGFEPREIRISSGQTVTFTTTRDARYWPASDLHPEHTIYPEFDPLGPIEPDKSWSFTFKRVGTWGFHDHIRSYFTGIIYVDPAL